MFGQVNHPYYIVDHPCRHIQNAGIGNNPFKQTLSREKEYTERGKRVHSSKISARKCHYTGHIIKTLPNKRGLLTASKAFAIKGG